MVLERWVPSARGEVSEAEAPTEKAHDEMVAEPRSIDEGEEDRVDVGLMDNTLFLEVLGKEPLFELKDPVQRQLGLLFLVFIDPFSDLRLAPQSISAKLLIIVAKSLFLDFLQVLILPNLIYLVYDVPHENLLSHHPHDYDTNREQSLLQAAHRSQHGNHV